MEQYRERKLIDVKNNVLRVLLALVIALTLVIGSINTVSAAGRPTITCAITNVQHYSLNSSPYGEPGNMISLSWQWSNMVRADYYTWELYNTTGGDGAWWIVDDGGFSSILAATPDLTDSTTVWEGYAGIDDTYVLIVKLYWEKIPRPFATVTDNWSYVSP